MCATLASAACSCGSSAKVRTVGGKNDHGNYIALAVAQLGQQIGAAPLASATSSTARSKSLALQRAPRLLDRIDRNDIANFAESASDDIVIDMKDSRAPVRLAREGLGKQPPDDRSPPACSANPEH
jgi:hypothetical protein